MKLLLLFLLFLVAIPLAAAGPATDRESLALEQLRVFVEKQRIPGLSIAVAQAEGPIWTATLGVKDLEAKTPVTVDSIFPLGSTSKILTSLVLGRLLDQGKLDLDAPIQRYLPLFPTKPWPITSRQLGGHLAGLRDYDMATEYDNRRAFATVEAAVAVFKDDPLLFEPGTRYAYSAYNFVLLSAVLEGAGGRDFLSQISDLTSAIGLERTGPARDRPELVTSYLVGPFGVILKAPAVDVSNKWAAGGLISTPTEMARLGRAIIEGKVVKPETFKVLTTAQKLRDGTISPGGYALGWRTGEQELPSGRKIFGVHHGGVARGGMSFFIIFPGEKLVVSLMVNLTFQPFDRLYEQTLAIAELFLAPP